jgi:Tfp pilus assembly protein PilN
VRIPINLAFRPAENLGLLRGALTLSLLAAVVLGGLAVQKAQHDRKEFRSMTEEIRRLEQSLAALQSEQRELQQWLETPQVQQIQQRAAFLNSLILQKSFSWTQLFMDLEQILPAQARITTIRPSIDESNEAELSLTVAAPAIAPLVEFLKNLESTPQFSAPQVGSQRFPTQPTAGEAISIDLTTKYRRSIVETPAPASGAPERAETQDWAVRENADEAGLMGEGQ